ncbi:hypothetical protein POSPLADRAFT_1046660 [Postia placenta MAD-698-R-SB12]|uniref:Uncharacterized protein n=1 Tax=Postia placenta MAD-698-R-SB12 TaxID=670580 RepID=A0A1X6N1C3_9APHY|nr:hypothetical protein POSPLADRAFT_1046660 [Postia placenta MAD-698-R-SB12]OSX62300.1 hypothetical protein POSPLADRAFT_1046660 [Postia placenta MAD-698-R-SB12]
MVHWQDPDVVLLISFTFSQMLVFTLGLYGWQLLITFHYVEWPLLTRRLNFKPIYNSRWALWTHKRWVQLTLMVLCIAHIIISFIVGLMNVKPTEDNHTLCGAVTSDNHRELAIFVAYTVFFDIVILCSTLFGLGPKSRLGNRRLWAVVHRQGILYVVTAVVVNVPSLVFTLAALNPIMDIFFSIPAFISLMNLKEDDSSERQGERQELTDMSTAAKGNGQFTTNVEITPSLFLNSGHMPINLSTDSFDESPQSTSRSTKDGGYDLHCGLPSRPPGDLGSAF